MKIGFELEAFCLRERENWEGGLGAGPHPLDPILVPDGMPFDECGWLVEIRSEPHTDITKAIYLLKAEQELVEAQAKKANCVLSYVPLFEIPRDLKVQAARRNGKGLISYKNIYGHETHKNSTKLATASLHISFTNERTYTYFDKENRKQEFKYPGFVDHAKIIVGLDKAFKTEINRAKRNPGFYEIKTDGRIEYRSLPNDVDLNKVNTVLSELLGKE